MQDLASKFRPELQELNVKFVRLVGRGQFGTVFKVERLSDGQPFALKVVDVHSCDEPTQTHAVNQVQLLMSPCHTNVIRCHDVLLSRGFLCTLMDYAPKGDLAYYISRDKNITKTPFPEEIVWRLLLQLCGGLMALHAKHIIHRNLTPANILLANRDLIKIAGMGVCKELQEVHRMTYTLTGTPCYIAPEVWTKHGYTFSSDLWSLGAVLYEMMTFRRPYDGSSAEVVRDHILDGQYPAIAKRSYSADLIAICYGLLNTKPNDRPSLDQILTSEAAQKWQWVMPGDPPQIHCSAAGEAHQHAT